ncbi:acyl-CoA N-acyltransferase [Irpex rosettiformis]|uniref:Acyl-CoA N-acyltransferase n=1 Tax=Irpex rosettiformis TaxID=378272 RepID=A0ACB8U6M7_9APHY|nr:acyl-CoA N-acyltransferase [Irpex rosettiformis]
MPQVFHVPQPEFEGCIVNKNGLEVHAFILERRPDEVYVHYANTDKRLDEWVLESSVRLADVKGSVSESHLRTNGAAVAKKRKRSISPVGQGTDDEETAREVKMSEEEYDIEHHKQITAKRNFDKVNFGKWQIKTWYFSPYPLIETEMDEPPTSASVGPPGTPLSSTRIPGVSRSTVRSHGRTSDLLAGGLGRSHGTGEKSTLWVCDKCFKYMTEGLSWELHVRKCTRRHPPGRKVYQRGAHIIWEVDGAKEKLYCQNLSLFGKLFIDIKTLFFDCDNFLFYILTDADSQRDHVLGFFSKEKVSYDDYNLACIVVLPPYQKKGYGMLLIEFSYELSRRAGKLGTPERPLSDLGLRSYLTYWIATLVRYFRRLLSVLPADTKHVVSQGSTKSQTPEMETMSPVRDTDDPQVKAKKKKSTKGWDGEVGDRPLQNVCFTDGDDLLFSTLRTVETTANPDGSATSHLVVRCTLSDIAQATGLRVEDVAFAMNECGMLQRHRRVNSDRVDKKKGDRAADPDDQEEYVVISREWVETIAKERNVKRMCMDLAHVLL